jgi:hypothetical protein
MPVASFGSCSLDTVDDRVDEGAELHIHARLGPDPQLPFEDIAARARLIGNSLAR